MSTELTFYDRINDPMAAVDSLGHTFAASGMMGAETPAQGRMLALQCFAEGVPPFTLQRRNHVIKGQITMKAAAMLAGFNAIGGKHWVVEQTDKAAQIGMIWEGRECHFRFTWEEALQEPFVYNGKEEAIVDALEAGNPPKLKPKYRTPRSRMQMLWSRCIDHAVQTLTPQVNHGIYTPEIASDIADERGHSDGTRPVEVDAEIVEGELVASSGEVVATATEEAPFDAPAAASKPAQSESANGGTAGMCTADQSNRIKELWGLLNVSPENRDKQLQSRKASGVRNLTSGQAVELIGKLEDVLAKKSSEPAKPGNSDADIASQVRELLKQVEQVHPGTVAAFKKKMAERSIAKIDDLRREDLLSLLSALRAPHDIEKYFAIVMWEAIAKN